MVLSPTIFTVDSTGSGTSGSGTSGTLPYIISQANANTNTDGSEIEFGSSVFSSQQTITLGATLVLSETTGPEMIDGPGAGLATVSGGGTVRVFEVERGVTATLSGLSISDGLTPAAINGGPAPYGGGLYNSGNLTLTDCTISGNRADGVAGAPAGGGGLFNNGGMATLTNCTVSGNSAIGGGGGLSNFGGGTAMLTDCTISGNSASSGAGVNDSDGTATLTACTIDDNSASHGGGGVMMGQAVIPQSLTLTDCTISGNSAGVKGVYEGYGGGVYNIGGTATITGCTISDNYAGGGGGLGNVGGGTAKLTACTISGNSAQDGGGGIYNNYQAILTGCTITSNSALNVGGGIDNSGVLTLASDTLSGNSAFDGGGIQNFGSLTLTTDTLSGNAANDAGAGIDNDGSGSLTVTRSTLTNNTAAAAGGVANSGFAALTDSTIADNTANQGGGGGLFNNGGLYTLTNCTVSGNSATQNGGGLYNFEGGTTTLTNCTVNGNSATNGGGLFTKSAQTTLTNCTVSGNIAGNQGGGLYFWYGGADLTNCTVSGNSATNGGGLYYNGSGMATLADCTISGNSATDDGGGVDNASDTFTIGNSIVAVNTATTSGPDAYGTFASQGNNLIGETDGGTGWVGSDLTGTIAQPINPLLAPLAYYGGPTETMLLLPGSPAINAGNNALIPTGVTTDQRGFARIANSIVDIGAFEVQSIPLVVNTTADGGGCPLGMLDLRGAIDLADIQPGAQTITFDPTVFASAQTITLTAGQLTLSDTTGTKTITGPAAALTISGGGLSRVFQVDSGVTASFSGLAITGGSTTGNGGGLYNDGGTTTLTAVTISGNSASGSGGGLYSLGGTTTLSDVTISGNSASGGGGGLANAGGSTTLTNCTVSGNSANNGGGLYNNDSGMTTLADCTISGNSASNDGGGIDNASGTVTLGNTIVAVNTASTSGPDAYGTFASQGNNLIGETDGGTGWVGSDLTGTIAQPLNPLLAPLEYYGGPTETMALLTGSPAIDAGNIALIPAGVTTDQRGFARIINSTVDIGAYEVQAIPLVFNTAADGGGCPLGELDLRGAIDLANILPGAQTITFDPTVFASDQTITLTSGQLELSNTTGTETIIGPGEGVTISGGGLSRVFQVDSGVTASLSGLTITGGYTTGNGGGLYDDGGVITLTGVTLSGNSAMGLGGALFVTKRGTTTMPNCGMTNCTVSGNSAGSGGGLYIYGGTTKLTNVTFSGNSASLGGALFVSKRGTTTMTNCDLTSCTVSGNSAGSGGGLYIYGGMTTLTNSTFSDNSASIKGGALFVTKRGTTTGTNCDLTSCTVSGNSAGTGGGLYIYGGMTTLTNSTISGNSASIKGGAVFVTRRGTTTMPNCGMINCTVTGNSATEGGGLYSNTMVSVYASTIAANSASKGGGIYNGTSYGNATLEDTIVAGNTGTGGAPSDIGGGNSTGVSGTYNLVGIGGSGGLANGVNGNIVLSNLSNLGLGPLGNYGGATETMPLLPGSAAIGAGSAISGITTDQRGAPLDSTPDIGAFQSQGFALTVVTGSTPQDAFAGSEFTNPLGVTVTANNPLYPGPVAGGVVDFSVDPAENGASASLSAATAIIGSNGIAQVTATADSIGGSYAVTVSSIGATSPASFALTNLIATSFSGVPNKSITYGTSSVTADGTLGGDDQSPPPGEIVEVTLNGVQQPATIGTAGAFSTTFNNMVLSAADSPYTISYTYPTDGIFDAASTTSTLTVNPAALTITAASETKVYGTADPGLAYAVSGLQFSDTAGSVLTGSLARANYGTRAGEQVGGYAITQGTLACDRNYTISFTGNTLTISAAALAVNATSKNKVYGTNDPQFSTTVNGLVNATVDGVTIHDTVAIILTGSPARAGSGTLAGEQAGGYAITQGTLVSNSDYSLNFTGGTLTINPAPLAVAANPQIKVYGTNDPTLTVATQGLVDGSVDGVTIDDTAASVLAGSLARAPGETVAGGPYAITQGNSTADSDYTISFTASTLTITPATLEIAAEHETKVFGSADPALAYTVSGLAFTDTPAGVLSGSLSRAPGETVPGGPYAIRLGSLTANSNYSISFTGNSLSIAPAAPTVKVSDTSGPYTGSPFAATATITGVGGAAASSLEGVAPTLAYYVGSGTSGTKTGPTPPTASGTYTVVASFAGSADYSSIQSAPVTFTIGQATPTIALTASVGSAVYRQSVTFIATVAAGATPAGTVTFLDGGTPLGTVALNGSGQATLVATALPVGTHSITASYNGNANLLGVQSKATSESVTQADTQVVLVPKPVFSKKKQVTSVGLEAEIKPIVPGGGVPTGTVTFEIVKTVKKKTKTKTLGTVAVSGGDATLTLKANKVLNMPIKIVYSGDTDFASSTASPPALTQSKLKSLARPMIPLVVRGRPHRDAARITPPGRA